MLQSFEECVEMVSIRVRGYFVARASWSTPWSAVLLRSFGVNVKKVKIMDGAVNSWCYGSRAVS